MPLRHNNKNTPAQGVQEYDQPVGSLGTGLGPGRNPTLSQSYDTSSHPPPAGIGAHHEQNMTYLPPQQQGGLNDRYAKTVRNNDVPPVSHFSSGQKTGSGSSTTGKIEKALGTVLHNPKLKAKGIEKEREAQALKAQSMELAEAERLEHEARLRRERAVQHGAHPANRALGGSAQAQQYGANFGGPGQDSAALGPNAQMANGGRGQLL